MRGSDRELSLCGSHEHTSSQVCHCVGGVGRVGNKAISAALYRGFKGVMDKDMMLLLQKDQQTTPWVIVRIKNENTLQERWTSAQEAVRL